MAEVIGLTGGIGAGKTAAARFIEEAGYPVYNSDVRAKELVNESAEIKEKITALLGAEAYDEKGFYNRKWVAAKVFNNEKLLKKLNLIIHPAVNKDFHVWKDRQEGTLVFKETALLFELKLNHLCFRSILVTADRDVRIERVMQRDGKTYREVEKVMENQMLQSEKMALTDYVIENNGDLETLKANTLKVLKDLEELVRRSRQ